MNNEETLTVDTDQVRTAAKNTDGHLGPICNTCGGFGFTLTFGGVSHSTGCRDCNQTGVAAMTNAELQAKVVEIGTQLHELKQIIIKASKEKGT